MSTVDRNNPLPLWAQVLDDLRVRLAAGEFAGRFPTDPALVAEYGVSRQTVREAVRRLQADGLLERERGRGTFVRDATLRQPIGTLPEIFRSVRAHLGPVTSTVRRLELTVDPDVAERLALPADAELVIVDRLRHVSAAPIAHDVAWLPAEVGRPLLDVDFTAAVLADEVRERCGLIPDDVAEEIAAHLATATDRSLLELPDDVGLLEVATCSAQVGAAYEFRRVVFRSDRIRLTAHWNRANRPTLGAVST